MGASSPETLLSSKQKAKNELVKNFIRDLDYTLNQTVKRVKGNRGGGSVRYEEIRLTIDCFKSLAMMAGTQRGKEVRMYFLECEKIAKQAVQVVNAQNEEIVRLNKILEIERLRTRQRELDHSMLTIHGAPTVLALRGQEDQIVEVEKPTIEIIDQRHNVSFKGQTLRQIRDYIAQKYGINFKSGAAIKQQLEQLGYAHLIAQTPRSVVSNYVQDEHLEQVYRLLRSGNRQMLLGE